MQIKGMILDLDGTVYSGKMAIAGAAEFIKEVRRRGVVVLFATNRANRTPREVSLHLRELGIPCSEKDILTAAQATARYLKKGSVYYIGETGLRSALKAEGHTVNHKSPDYVIVSYDRSFNYDKLKTACSLISKGARFIATNPDKGLPTENGMSPGTGAIVAAVEAGSGIKPVVIGKPGRILFDMAIRQLHLPRKSVIAVGDNLDTDIPAGRAAGIRTALILTGVTSRAEARKSKTRATWTAHSCSELLNMLSRSLPKQ